LVWMTFMYVLLVSKCNLDWKGLHKTHLLLDWWLGNKCFCPSKLERAQEMATRFERVSHTCHTFMYLHTSFAPTGIRTVDRAGAEPTPTALPESEQQAFH
jgi:hypothetical protein